MSTTAVIALAVFALAFLLVLVLLTVRWPAVVVLLLTVLAANATAMPGAWPQGEAPPAAVPSAEAPREPYDFGVFPTMATLRLEEVFAPIAAGLGEALGRPVRFRSTSSYEQYMENLEKGLYEIAYVQPFDFVRLASPAGYQPLLARPGMLEAKLMVRDESPLRELAELRDRTLGTPPRVAAVTYLSHILLLDKGLEPGRDVTLRHFRTHESCLQQLLLGTVDACASGSPVIESFADSMGAELRILARSVPIPSSLFVMHPRLGKAERERVIAAFATLDFPAVTRAYLDPEGRPLRPAAAADYEIVDKIWQRVRE